MSSRRIRPKGYKETNQDGYKPQGKRMIFVARLIWIFLSLISIWIPSYLLELEFNIKFESVIIASVVEIALIGTMFLISTAVHEVIHYLVFRIFGYRSRINFNVLDGEYYAEILDGQLFKVNHLRIACILPLLIITPAGLILAAMSSSLFVVYIGLYVAVDNFVGSFEDINMFRRYSKLPASALFYENDRFSFSFIKSRRAPVTVTETVYGAHRNKSRFHKPRAMRG